MLAERGRAALRSGDVGNRKPKSDRPLTRLLNDVQADACKPQTRAPWHFGILLDYTSDTTRLSGHTLGWLSGLSLKNLAPSPPGVPTATNISDLRCHQEQSRQFSLRGQAAGYRILGTIRLHE